MKRALVAACMLVVLVTSGCSSSQDLTRPATQDNFGVQMARMNLWREALFRFQRAVEINPGDSMAHNNLAVAYEANGEFENARKEYLEALKLDKSNQYIQKNYSRYVEFLSRNKKKPVLKPGTAPAPAPAASPGAPSPAAPPLPRADQPNPPAAAPPNPTHPPHGGAL